MNIPKFFHLIGKRYTEEDGANSDTESLLTHSFAVANEARRQARLCLLPNQPFGQYLEDMAWLCGFVHDIGKCTVEAQEHIAAGKSNKVKSKKKTLQINYYDEFHNITGAILFHNLFKVSVVGSSSYRFSNFRHQDIVTRSILYHHPLPYINKGKNESWVMKWRDEYEDFIRYIIKVANENLSVIKLEYQDPTVDCFSGEKCKIDDLVLTAQKTPSYYLTDSKDFTNQFNFILDQIVKMSDVIMSNPAITPDNHSYFNAIHYRQSNITPSDIQRPADYDSRYELQCEYAEKLAGHNISFFDASTGFGKTGTGLHYILSQKTENRKAFWICPRNSIAKSVYKTIVDELKVRGLGGKITVDLLLANDWMNRNEKADIIVTNIDNFLRPIIKNDVIKRTFNMLSATCVFDEFHEYIGGNSPLMATFDVILKSREFVNARTLLLSATPSNYFTTLSKESVYKLIHVDDKIAGRIYDVHYGEDNIPWKLNNTLWQIHSRQTVQDLVRGELTDDIFHSCYLERDKKEKFERIFSEHGKDGSNPDVSYTATNIIGTGVDVSFKNLAISLPSPDSLIQSLGRCNRWCKENDNALFILPEGVDKREIQTVSAIFGTSNIHTTFCRYLQDKLPAGRHTFGEICQVREGFYKEKESLCKDFFRSSLQRSYERLVDFRYDYVPEDKEKTNEKFIGNNILRSDGLTDGFWCRLVMEDGITECTENFCADTWIVNLLRNRSLKDLKEIANHHDKKVKSGLKSNEKKMIEKKGHEEYIRYFIKKAHSDKYPFFIHPNFYRYSKKYGLIKK